MSCCLSLALRLLSFYFVFVFLLLSKQDLSFNRPLICLKNWWEARVAWETGKKVMGCFLDRFRAFGINADRWGTTAAQDEEKLRKTAEQAA